MMLRRQDQPPTGSRRTVRFETPTEPLPGLAALVRLGFAAPLSGALSVRRFLLDRLTLPADYLEHRISTIFLDGKPVDDLDRARVQPGSTLGLSAAMPGIAGITMRRNSPVAALRADITHRPQEADLPKLCGSVFVKAFNLVAVEIGPFLLDRGIDLVASSLVFWLRDWMVLLEQSRVRVLLDKLPVGLKELSSVLEDLGQETLRVTVCAVPT
ncbi:MAG: hypothetical protein JW797_06635 [Bradymonadales bacterium]|nr:hypothetical protein [Bradymonadales bacterium]